MDIHDRVQALKHLESAAELLNCKELHQRANELRDTISILDIYYCNEEYDAFIEQWKNEYNEGSMLDRNLLLCDIIVQYTAVEVLSGLSDWLLEHSHT